jgi:hypothetical protein
MSAVQPLFILPCLTEQATGLELPAPIFLNQEATMGKAGRMMSVAAGSVIAGIFLFGGTAGAAPAAGMRHGPCADDVAKFCKDVQPGGGRMAQCLKQHEQELSSACKIHVENVKKQGQAFRAACEDDVLKLCGGVQAGDGRMLNCLKQHEQELTPDCREKMQHNQSRGK